MAIVYMLQRFLFPSDSVTTALSVACLAFMIGIAVSEIIGKHLQYSKFWNYKSNSPGSSKKQIELSSKIGMLMFYTPAFLAGVASFGLFPSSDLRFLLVKAAVSVHFLKRDLEVLFVHKFSGGIILDSAILISFGYLTSALFLIYAQHLTQQFQEPLVDLKYIGTVIFLLGICGNFYHHKLLASLRKPGEKSYKIPNGGLFNLVICPHYLFEIVGFVGISLISQTLVGFSLAIGVCFYLMARSYVTRKWYLSKFEDFPKNVKAIIPFVF